MHASGANTTDGVDDAVASAVFPEGWFPTKQVSAVLPQIVRIGIDIYP